ncbi:MAG: hypothetical protein K8F36_14730 [Melioribacteraceae bacterium]|nr:hypothetical protein [Melioribacteraceae bacterium]
MQNNNSVRFYPKSGKENTFEVCLDLPFEQRFIGELSFEGEGTFTCNRTESKHLFRKLNAIGLNHKILTSDKISFKWIVINYQTSNGFTKKLITTRDYWKTNGQVYQFSKKGYEVQSFLSLDKFGIEKARLYESSKTLNLFNEVQNGIRQYKTAL